MPFRAPTPGQLRRPLTIQVPSDVHNADGSITRTWGGDTSRWARVLARGQESDHFATTSGHLAVELTFRWDSYTSVMDSEDRVLDAAQSRTYEILRFEPRPPHWMIAIAIDYGPMVRADGLTYDGNTYDVILENEDVVEEYTETGKNDARVLPARLRISDFGDGIVASGAECTVNGKTYVMQDMVRGDRCDWYRVMLHEENVR